MRPKTVHRVIEQVTRNPQGITRMGNCNNCGVCCQLLKGPQFPRDSIFYADTKRYEFCVHYDPDGKAGHCSIWNKRSPTCREWPRSPMDTQNKGECSYWFVDGKGAVVDAYQDRRVRLDRVAGRDEVENYPFPKVI